MPIPNRFNTTRCNSYLPPVNFRESIDSFSRSCSPDASRRLPSGTVATGTRLRPTPLCALAFSHDFAASPTQRLISAPSRHLDRADPLGREILRGLVDGGLSSARSDLASNRYVSRKACGYGRLDGGRGGGQLAVTSDKARTERR